MITDQINHKAWNGIVYMGISPKNHIMKCKKYHLLNMEVQKNRQPLRLNLQVFGVLVRCFARGISVTFNGSNPFICHNSPFS